ncbi:DNA translocase FtsK [Paenilisteria rocourtiae]|uniref:S-DNA-T family DNA segregation ATPase FtsK/SpoIIIE n=1 Tax=Listeria rocourtiae TaxID=647910 RepID=A0A4R6ZM21_9LIST|nr:DNA translocase FtsK [Listeria rocourtiae]EUJ44979.1 FtsK/SpoIIIE family protein [Listeria rocourtiae FSL F6-920]MBC1603984.1 DNA translocase FtsK [Listeria rocourtiae]TDR53507.1 S-DNA-T family DNA segregation ATPase FtsK/SpoIIIE [Listeria rocourtiae]
MGWFKDFFFADRDAEYEEIEVAKPKEKAQSAPTPQLTAVNKVERKVDNFRENTQSMKQKREVQAKVMYQYPKGEFRFPLIPDGQKIDSKPVLHKIPMPNQTPRSKTNNEIPKFEKKRPFRPTDVPSPVFAFQKRPSRFEFDITQEAEASEATPDVVEQLVVEAEPVVEAFVSEEVAILEDVTEQEAVSPVIEEPEIKAIQEEVMAPQRIDLIHEAPKPKKDKQAPPKTRIPFNVMMVNQDKQHVEQKKEVIKKEPDMIVETEKSAIAPDPIFPVEQHLGEDASGYYFPSLDLLKPPVFESADEEWLAFQEELLNETLENFNVSAKVVNVTQGPAVTRFEVQPEKGVKVSKITNLTDDIKLNLAAKDIRIEAPIPGKSTIGIEIPNETSRPVMLSEIMNSQAFQASKSPLTAALGLDISGMPIVTDLQTMPHGLIAGATGSGKSVCINSLLISLLYKATPDELKLLLIDPKMVELAPYNRIPHLVSPVITDAKAATAALKWAVEEMERRYQLFSHAGVRNMEKFNEYSSHPEHSGEKLPYILIIIDELADLMMVAPNDVEEAISRIAQKARACGIHMIVATQRPSVDVITGLIKANIPTRVSFSVSSQIDSRTIIDTGGAEKLLGKGDMLFLPSGSSKPVRLQGTYVGDQEIDTVIAHVRNQAEPNYLFKQEELLEREIAKEEEDDLFDEACDFVLAQNGASTSLLQRHFRIGYNRAARLMEALEKHSIVSETNGSKPRDVIITREQLEKIRDN